MMNPRATTRWQQEPRIGFELLTPWGREVLFRVIGLARQVLDGLVGSVDELQPIGYGAFDFESGGRVATILWPLGEGAEGSDEVTTLKDFGSAYSFLVERAASGAAYEEQAQAFAVDACTKLIAVCTARLTECPVCGFPGQEPPYAEDGSPSYATCRACGFHFDDADDGAYEFSTWRQRWIANGMPFAIPPCPTGWEPPASFSR
jgi:hypothetical protein